MSPPTTFHEFEMSITAFGPRISRWLPTGLTSRLWSLIQLSGPLFIVAATISRFIGDPRGDPGLTRISITSKLGK
jgi:hypothetical protein